MGSIIDLVGKNREEYLVLVKQFRAWKCRGDCFTSSIYSDIEISLTFIKK